MTAPLVSLRDLTVDFAGGARDSRAVDGVSLEIAPGEALGIVGDRARARA